MKPEKAFTLQVIEIARYHGWRIVHFDTAQGYRGEFRTPYLGDGRGFPDIVAVRKERVVWAELKTATGRLTDQQKEWLDDLLAANQEVYLWRPSDLDWLTRVFARATRPTADKGTLQV